ncbi:MAG: hypothetical protein SFU98_05990 [Leptospiraceae bacterium]|nr:hypothetical protein [Leptospiraceae bacterium]
MSFEQKSFSISGFIGIVFGLLFAIINDSILELFNTLGFNITIFATIFCSSLVMGFVGLKLKNYRRIIMLVLGTLLAILSAILQSAYLNFFGVFSDKNYGLWDKLEGSIAFGFMGIVFLSYIIFPTAIIMTLLIEKFSRRQ